MTEWIREQLPTILVSLVLIAVVAAAVAGMVRDKRKGKASCGCGCAHCAMRDACHRAADKTER